MVLVGLATVDVYQGELRLEEIPARFRQQYLLSVFFDLSTAAEFHS